MNTRVPMLMPNWHLVNSALILLDRIREGEIDLADTKNDQKIIANQN